MWRLTLLNQNDTIGLFSDYNDAKKFVARKGLDEYEMHPCWVTLDAVEGSCLDEKFREGISVVEPVSTLVNSHTRYTDE